MITNAADGAVEGTVGRLGTDLNNEYLLVYSYILRTYLYVVRDILDNLIT